MNHPLVRHARRSVGLSSLLVSLSLAGCASLAGHEDKTYDPLADVSGNGNNGGSGGRAGNGGTAGSVTAGSAGAPLVAGSGGSSGASGNAGSGEAGATSAGSGGASGAAGAGADAGAGGNAGASGIAGTSSNAGASGSAGLGGAGNAGTSGTAGTGANAGAAGTPGTGGNAGAAGNPSTGGNAGASGNAGAAGASGNAGESGSAGAAGANGCTPPTFTPHAACSGHAGEWVLLGKLQQRRSLPFVVRDGDTLLVGGGSRLDSNPATCVERVTISATGATSTCLYDLQTASRAATLGSNGKLYVPDNYGARLTVCEKSACKTVTPNDEAPNPALVYRKDASIVRLLDGVLAFGGQDPADPPAASFVAQLYRPISNLIGNTPNPDNRENPAIVPVGTDRWLVVGGRSFSLSAPSGEREPSGVVERLTADAANAKAVLTTLSPLQQPRRTHTATRLLDGRVVVVGGYTRQVGVAEEVGASTVEIIDDATGTVHKHPNALQSGPARGDHGAALLPDGRLLVGGGSGTFLIGKSTEIFTPTCPIAEGNEGWEVAAEMPLGETWYPTFVSMPYGVISIGGVRPDRNGQPDNFPDEIELFCP